jgi:choline dehydrogenase-like flavoprotein
MRYRISSESWLRSRPDIIEMGKMLLSLGRWQRRRAASDRIQRQVALRVADASIMPSDCRANTHLTTVVIGEAIARMMMREDGRVE